MQGISAPCGTTLAKRRVPMSADKPAWFVTAVTMSD
jgi:hypothetical protein